MRNSITITNSTRGQTLVARGKATTNRWERGKGLIGHAPLQPGEGLLIRPCSSVHTFWMSFPIDVVYVDQSHRVVALAPNLVPNRIGPIARRAAYVIELPAGAIDQTGTEVGDQLAVDAPATAHH
jgi:uncharacterized protein